MAVAPTAFSAVRDDDAFTIRNQIGEDFTGFVVVYDGADWERDDDGFPSSSRAIGSASGFPVFRFVVSLVSEVEERGEPMRGRKDDIPAVSPVSTVRATSGDEHLPAETATAVSTAAGFDGNTDFIDEHWIPSSVTSEQASPGGILRGIRALQEILPVTHVVTKEKGSAPFTKSRARGRR